MDNIDFSKIYSASKLSLFEECPKAYHFSYLDELYSKMKSKLRRDSNNIWPFQTLGKAVHDALTLFFYLPQEEQFLENLKDELKLTWRSEAMPNKLPPLGKWGGFKTLEEERENYKEALLMLSKFYQIYDKNSKIKYLPTKNLYRSIEDYKKLVKPISENYDISGKIDLVVTLADGQLEVIDFKTGRSQSHKDFQLKFYKLLAEENFDLSVTKASFYFLRTGKIKEFDLSKEDNFSIKKLILEKIDKINQEKEFIPKPTILCKYCLYRNFCPAKKEVGRIIQEPLKQEFIDDLPF